MRVCLTKRLKSKSVCDTKQARQIGLRRIAISYLKYGLSERTKDTESRTIMIKVYMKVGIKIETKRDILATEASVLTQGLRL